MTELRIAAILGLIAAVFAFGFGASHLQADAKIKGIEAKQAQAVAAANASALAAQKQLDAERDAKAVAVAAIDSTQTALLRAQQNENEKLKRCIADGTCGLRIAAKCAPSSNHVSSTTAGASVDAGEAPTLDAAARQDYFALRDSIAIKERQLEGLQQIVTRLTTAQK